MDLHRIPWLRKIALTLLRRFGNFDVTVKHHHTGDPFSLHAYRHKGFWYHGRKRESQSLERCRALLHSSDTVIEVGGHIGYLSVLFARCAPDGRVYVFEPGRNNLPYLRRNTENLANVVKDGWALRRVGDFCGWVNRTADAIRVISPGFRQNLSRPRVSLDTSLEGMMVLQGGGHGQTQASEEGPGRRLGGGRGH